MEPHPSTRSTFVTILGWLGVCFGMLGVLVSALQLVMVGAMGDSLAQAATDPALEQMPAIFRWIFANFALFILANLAVMAMLLAASVGLLRRRNWARLTIVGMLAVSIAANILGVFLQYDMMQSMAALPGATTAPDMEGQLAAIRFAFVGFSALFALVIGLLYGWVIRKLLSPAIRREFGIDAQG